MLVYIRINNEQIGNYPHDHHISGMTSNFAPSCRISNLGLKSPSHPIWLENRTPFVLLFARAQPPLPIVKPLQHIRIKQVSAKFWFKCENNMTIRDELSNNRIRNMQDLFHHSETRQLVNLDCFSCSLTFQITNVSMKQTIQYFHCFSASCTPIENC